MTEAMTFVPSEFENMVRIQLHFQSHDSFRWNCVEKQQFPLLETIAVAIIVLIDGGGGGSRGGEGVCGTLPTEI